MEVISACLQHTVRTTASDLRCTQPQTRTRNIPDAFLTFKGKLSRDQDPQQQGILWIGNINLLSMLSLGPASISPFIVPSFCRK
eukprot:scaffold38914_cov21-Tisochrysis_lutea.AAC.3